METQIVRQSINYPLMTDKFKDWRTNKIIKFVQMPTSLNINFQGNLFLVFEGWESVQHFETKQESVSQFRVEISTPIEVVKENFAEVFKSLNTEILNFMELSETNYEAANFTVNLDKLNLSAFAKHLDSERNQTSNLFINSIEKFEEVKTQNPMMVGLLIKFCWQYGRQNNQNLADLTPLHPDSFFWK